MDDPYVVCPYNQNHHVSRSRLQAHIVKCEKVYPKLGICIYNATHRVPVPELEGHLKNCPDAHKFEVPLTSPGNSAANQKEKDEDTWDDGKWDEEWED